MGEMTNRVARAIGACYDGYADPVETPHNWARATEAARAAIEAMRDYLNITNNSSLNYTADELDAELRESS
jgi:hypothetical protein